MRKSDDAICLLAALDEGYVPQLGVLLTSIYLNHPGEPFCLYLMHSGLGEESLEKIGRRCRRFGFAFHPVFTEEELFAGAPVSSRYPKEMYYRLLAYRLLPPSVRRILYLDPDILAINSLRPLWEMELGGCLFAAAAHTGKTELANSVNRLRLGTDHDYYNSGVLLMDLEACRKEMDPETLFAFVREHEHELLLPDQDVLNAMYGDRILPLDDAVWNYDARNYNNYLLRSSGVCDAAWVMEHTSLLHFCGRAKPWKPGYFYRFGMLYRHYMRQAERYGTEEP